MQEVEVIKFPEIKIIDNGFEVEFEVELIPNEKVIDYRQDIQFGLDEVNRKLSSNNDRIDELNIEINRLTNNSDAIDYTVAVGSGILAGVIDSLWVGEFKMERGKAWSNKTVNDFVMKAAKATGYTGDRLDGAIKSLEDKFPIPSDPIWKVEGNRISAKSHHSDDLAHHPTPLGLFCSILTQFTKTGYFQNRDGQNLPITIGEKGEGLIGKNIPNKIFAGLVNWFFHLASDMSGTAKTAGRGMGIPGPIVSLLKEIAMLPGVKKTGLSEKVYGMFVKQRFDLRSELGVGYELRRQGIPVVLNEVIVRAFYFIRRLVMEIKDNHDFMAIDWKKTLPFRNRTIARMLLIATGTFTIVDLGDAAIRGAIKSGGNAAMFATQFILRVNFVGIGRFAIAVGTDVKMGIDKEKMRTERMSILSEQLHLMNAKVFYLQASTWVAAETAEKTINEVAKLMGQTIIISIKAVNENRLSMHNIGEYRQGVEKNNPKLIDDISEILAGG